jgi:6-pyruvoyltetrahydropterin/6-carboxytetrahydropterin synthase
MWTIDKQFSFCYGHRVWVQKLEHEFCASGDTATKCRHYHGHEGLVHVFLEGDELNTQAMVTDFKHLGWLKNFLDDNIDHKFILDINDPLASDMLGGELRDADHGNTEDFPYVLERFSGDYLYVQNVYVPGTDKVIGMRFDTSKMEEGPLKEKYDGYFLVTFIPTSENLSRWLWHCVNEKMQKLCVRTAKIDWFETPKSRASYSGPA